MQACIAFYADAGSAELLLNTLNIIQELFLILFAGACCQADWDQGDLVFGNPWGNNSSLVITMNHKHGAK